MIKAQSKDNEKKNLRYFFKKFADLRIKFPSVLFKGLTTRKKSLPVPYKIYKHTIISYLDSYFEDLYNLKGDMYFPISGRIRLAKGSQFFVNSKRKTQYNSRSIVWVWFQRPALAYFSNIRLIKMKGRGSKVDKLDKDYKENKDVELLPLVNYLLNELVTTKQLFKDA